MIHIGDQRAALLFALGANAGLGRNAEDKRFVVTKTYTASLNEKANLRKDLESWRGRPFTVEELQGFDLEKVVKAPCMLNLVAQTTKAGKTWTGIAAIMPLAKGAEKLDVEKASHKVFAEYGNVGTEFAYITKEGFGWMNASFQVGLKSLSPELARALRDGTDPERLFGAKTE